MSQKGHGTAAAPVQKDLRWHCSPQIADEICNFNRHFAERGGYWERSTSFLSEEAETEARALGVLWLKNAAVRECCGRDGVGIPMESRERALHELSEQGGADRGACPENAVVRECCGQDGEWSRAKEDVAPPVCPGRAARRRVPAQGEITFYDSNSGEALFYAPRGRSYDQFVRESKQHGWPSFRDDEVNWERVRVLPDGETVSIDGTHLGHNLPDRSGNRYCINLVSVAGKPVKQSE